MVRKDHETIEKETHKTALLQGQVCRLAQK